MYRVDGLDRVLPLTEVPQCSPGAPLPLMVADDFKCLLAYLINNPDPDWDGSTGRLVDPETTMEPVALVQFHLVRASYLGAPNDEAFSGHPLASRGLHPYGAFEVLSSSWIRGLERMNSVHPSHRPEYFASLRHFVFAFHDKTFECVAQRFEVSVHEGPRNRVIGEMCRRLR